MQVNLNAVEEKKREEFFKEAILGVLKRTFFEMRDNNPQFSLRAFARHLDIDPTFLSRLIAEKQPLTYKTSLRLAKALGLSVSDIFSNFRERRNITKKVFLPISRLQFFCLLQINKLKDFKPEATWISQRLGMKVSEVAEYLDTLESQGHMDRSGKNWEVNLKEARWDSIEDPNIEKKNFQKQVIRRAHTAIDEIPVAEREAYSLTIAANSKVLPEIQKKIRNLAEEIAEICANSNDKDHIYQYHCSFFPLTTSIQGDQNESV